MKAWIFSDLHVECTGTASRLEVPDADLCICAGNILERGLEPSVDWLAKNVAKHMPVLLVPGNRDYYHSSIKEGFEKGVELARSYEGIFLLDEGFVVLGGIRFVGATLWTDFALFGDPRLPMLEAAEHIDDYRRIKISNLPAKRFSPRQAMRLHLNARLIIEDLLAASCDLPTVVITHHAPSLLSMSQDWIDNPLAPSFASNLDRTILRYQPQFWIHGHLHNAADYMIRNTRVICNPRGYPRCRTGFNPTLVIDLGVGTPQRSQELARGITGLEGAPAG
ncbi:metallophosphoesterase [Pararhizobium sp. YC-54]|uniref:metallophosphoesterase n=1 Tax=Pararhizobium sp. YC-54 TaxID=2986920 RepID=UPI0021F6D8BF|nr:metallophosphoesterase [Pararhizobium sp. YC-54]MCW0001330.1 metallophosphoesterase [Pararhizobium sp. YC-54]